MDKYFAENKLQDIAIVCPICVGNMNYSEKKKAFLRPQYFYFMCQKESCATELKIDGELLYLSDTKNKSSNIWEEFKNIRLSPAAINFLAKREALVAEGNTQRCASCAHRIVGSICNNARSPFYSIKINQGRHFCDLFEDSVALAEVAKAMSLMLDDKLDGVVELYENALRLGLAEDDQVSARAFLGSAYLHSSKMEEGIFQLDKSMNLDAQHAVGFFSNKINRDAFFTEYAAATTLVADKIKEEKGPEEALAYLKERLKQSNYLCGVLMFRKEFFPMIHHHMAGYYMGMDDVKTAMKSLEKCEKAELDKESELSKKCQENAKEILEQYYMDQAEAKRARRG